MTVYGLKDRFLKNSHDILYTNVGCYSALACSTAKLCRHLLIKKFVTLLLIDGVTGIIIIIIIIQKTFPLKTYNFLFVFC